MRKLKSNTATTLRQIRGRYYWSWTCTYSANHFISNLRANQICKDTQWTLKILQVQEIAWNRRYCVNFLFPTLRRELVHSHRSTVQKTSFFFLQQLPFFAPRRTTGWRSFASHENIDIAHRSLWENENYVNDMVAAKRVPHDAIMRRILFCIRKKKHSHTKTCSSILQKLRPIVTQ